ncbi:sugar ABC transporter ATP-binding protein [Salibacterium qingdaonense]|uniref:Ribose transport system ATP-binding protein n=1 Tax=Salibacterium qingdaonense TaxID=266892 RepID=A0A1I4LDI9_9BACI|nr:sugar ABC transporter ATP-binding protein [Salibacterium qingdaonense]SFL88883.1 ribose transport system ATP-binding protein [Salibacterium qingdaonense]
MAFISMETIDKSFHQVKVLHQVNLDLGEGEIHALLGENGAGKSTLMNILGGVLQPDSGTIYVNGAPVSMTTPGDSQKLGISFIHQELNVVSDLRVYENMFLGSEIRNKAGFLNVEAMKQKTRDVLSRLGVSLDPSAYVRDLGTSHKQFIEISKALLRDSSVIIMDEPTTALSEHEISRLFELMTTLKESGVSIIYISHKLKEIKAICDRYTVLRDGFIAGTGSLEEEDPESITKMMVGRSVSQERFTREHVPGDEVMRVEDFSKTGLFQGIDFTIREGEIAGFTGLAGDGRTELFEALFGFRKKDSGSLYVHGKKVVVNHPNHALRAGIGLVPRDRKENAVIQDLSIVHNLTLSSLGHFEKNGFITKKQERKAFQRYKNELNIKARDPYASIATLSGGNQQKVVIAKWLEVNADVIIFDNPTQGIDVGAKREIYQHIVSLAEQGKSIIILSSEAPEILKMCEHIYVMYKGEITARLNRDETAEDEIMACATGSKRMVESIG